jgi:hypothetical protein
MSITIDGTEYDVALKIVNRKIDKLYKYAERVENGDLKSEILGVYFNFDVECGKSDRNATAYDNLIDKISEPTEVFEISMPYTRNSVLTFDCYFAGISDVARVWKEDNTIFYRDLRFSIIAISPARTPA